MFRSITSKLTVLYIGTVAFFLAMFVAMDYQGLEKNLNKDAAGSGHLNAQIEETLSRALNEHVFLALIMLIPVSFLGYFIIKRALSPVRKMTLLANRITAEDLSLRIDSFNESGEIGELAATLNGMIERLEKSFSHIKQFSADVSHELKTPLTVINGEIDVCLKKERDAAEYAETLKILKEQNGKLSKIIDDLLLLSYLENFKTLDIKPFRLDTLVLELFEEYAVTAGRKEIALELGRIDNIVINGNADLIRRMISNIIANGINYTEKGRVVINLEAEDSFFELQISDTGSGIPSGSLNRIFDRFYRVDNSRSSKTGGTGLGLSISKKISVIHGFCIEVRSVPEKGSTFIISNRPI